jgi:hypothetical protein
MTGSGMVEPMIDQNVDFEAAVIKLIPQLRAYAIGVMRLRDSSEDLVQDTLLRALRSRHTFAPGTNLKAWMFTILRNGFLSAIRRKRLEPAFVQEDDLEWPARSGSCRRVARRRSPLAAAAGQSARGASHGRGERPFLQRGRRDGRHQHRHAQEPRLARTRFLAASLQCGLRPRALPFIPLIGSITFVPYGPHRFRRMCSIELRTAVAGR